jgi:hypothetical protein
MSHARLFQPATLANGERVPLAAAASKLARVTEYLAVPDSEWDVVFYLREVCLGREIEPEQERALVRERLLEPDGRLDPVMRAVVLSAVRGVGRTLHIDSPFTDQVDRDIAEYLLARDGIRSALGTDEARAVLAYDPVQRLFDDHQQFKKWTEREDDRPDTPGDLPPR